LATDLFMTRGTYQVLLQVTDHDNRTAGAGVTVNVDPVWQRSMVLNASDQTPGAGESKAWIIPISLPSTELSAELEGTGNLTGCSPGGNCAAFVEILNLHYETNLTLGDAMTDPEWCLEANGSCQANRSTHLEANLD
jgi:hypothetical protein